MAFNPYYQNPYYPQPMPDNLMQMRQQQMMQPAPPPVPQNPVATGGVQWVSSEQEARGYLIAPNSAVALWDSTPRLCTSSSPTRAASRHSRFMTS